MYLLSGFREGEKIQIIQIPTSRDECLYSQALKKEPGSITGSMSQGRRYKYMTVS